MLNFNPKAKAFSRVNLAYLAHCAKIAYLDETSLKAELEKLGFDLSSNNFFISNKKTDTQGYVVGDKNKIIVAFRGTEQKLSDWATDLKARKVDWTEKKNLGMVHRGFYKALTSVWGKIYTEVKALRDNNQSIWITGHSLGGALAGLAAATFELQSPRIAINGVYTFGQPRLVSRKLAKKYNDKLGKITFRCVNNNDVVTRVPPQILGYSHIGKLVYFDVDRKLRTDSNLSWWSMFWDRIEGRYEDLMDLGPDGIKDHSMDLYESMSANAKK